MRFYFKKGTLLFFINFILCKKGNTFQKNYFFIKLMYKKYITIYTKHQLSLYTLYKILSQVISEYLNTMWFLPSGASSYLSSIVLFQEVLICLHIFILLYAFKISSYILFIVIFLVEQIASFLFGINERYFATQIKIYWMEIFPQIKQFKCISIENILFYLGIKIQNTFYHILLKIEIKTKVSKS